MRSQRLWGPFTTWCISTAAHNQLQLLAIIVQLSWGLIHALKCDFLCFFKMSCHPAFSLNYSPFPLVKKSNCYPSISEFSFQMWISNSGLILFKDTWGLPAWKGRYTHTITHLLLTKRCIWKHSRFSNT